MKICSALACISSMSIRPGERPPVVAASALASSTSIELARIDLTGFSWTRLIETIGMERTPEDAKEAT